MTSASRVGSGGLDVLVVESHRGAGADAARRLEAAGHRVHRCHDEGSRGFPCAGLTDDGCPIDRGVDVVLLTRRRNATRPTVLEAGVTCGLRRNVPLATDGPALLDPFAPWAAARSGEDVVSACEEAVEAARLALRHRVAELCHETLAANELGPDDVEVRTRRQGRGLTVRVDLPAALALHDRQAISTRTLDAIRMGGHRFDTVDVIVEERSSAPDRAVAPLPPSSGAGHPDA